MLDATTGQNGLSQARLFDEAADLTGVVLTKVDGTARGGIAVAIRRELGIPVKLVGSGEKLEDLQPFDAEAFARAIFAPDDERAAGRRPSATPGRPRCSRSGRSAMFDALTDKLQGIFSGLKGRGSSPSPTSTTAMRAIRLSLLEADVSLPVVKQLTTAIAARAKGAEVMDSLTPDQQVVKIVSDELTALMGEANVALPLASKPPTIVLMAGLQGSGKTTCSAKLARYFVHQGRAPDARRLRRPPPGGRRAARRPRPAGRRAGAPRGGRRRTRSPSRATASRRPAAPAATW